MPTAKQIIFACVLVCALLATAAAQNSSSSSAQSSSLTITATAADDRVRITAPSSVVQMHVEVYAGGGDKVFDQELRGGNVFDWHLQDGQGQRLAPGSYVCVVTAKSVSGKLTQKMGTVQVEEKSVRVQPGKSQQLSAPQAQAIGPVEEDSSWTIPVGDEQQTATVIAHDGADGQMIRGRGALTFRIGNFFTGNDREQMRLTEDGRLGIGTSEPKTTLDVAGTIRAQRYLVVKPKPTDAGKSAQEYLTANATEPEEALITGTGTQDRIAKWIDNSATLGDSSITEIGGNVGIGTTTPGSRLVVSSNSSTLPPALGIARFADADGVQTAVFADSFGTNPIFNVRRANGTAAAPSAVQANQLLGVIGASAYGASAYSGTRARVGFFASENWTNTANGTFLTFNTTANGAATAGGTERLRIDNAGNVGIGTTTPSAILNIVGAQPATVPGFGSSAASVLRVIGGKGGNSSGPLPGGAGGSIILQAGDAGDGFPAGFPGSIVLQPGLGNFGGSVQIALNGGGVGIGSANNSVDVNSAATFWNFVVLKTLSAASNPLCLDSQNVVANCPSSLRYKSNVQTFLGGLDVINRLRPIAFTWKQDGLRDIGLGAEEVEKIEPRLTFRNHKGEIEGVKYGQLSAVFINAFKEQQDQIAALRTANNALNVRLRVIERTLKNKRGAIRQRP